MSKNITYRVANKTDYGNVLEFIREHYYKEEPITISHPELGHTKDDEEFTMSHISLGTSLVAVDSDNNKIVGAFIAGKIEHGDAEKMLESSMLSEKKWADIQKLLAYIENKANVLGKFKLDKALHGHALGVHREYRGNKIGKNLFEKSIENAKKLNYKLLSVDCTSIFSMKIAEQVGMKCVSTVTYDEYHKAIGHELFNCQSPNTEIKTFVKVL